MNANIRHMIYHCSPEDELGSRYSLFKLPDLCYFFRIFGQAIVFRVPDQTLRSIFGGSWLKAPRKNREKIEGRFAAGAVTCEVLAIVRLHGIMNTVIGHGFAGR